MVPLRLKATVSDHGTLTFSEPGILREWLIRYSGKIIDVVFKSHSVPKTQPQLGYLFGHVIPQISDRIGYTEEEVYNILKFKFLRVDIGTDRERVVGLSDTDADCGMVNTFIEKCIQFGTDVGAEIYPSKYYGG